MVYLIHFDRPFHHAQHYLGYCEESLGERLARHKAGQGSKLLRAVRDAGIGFKVVRIWEHGDRNFERRLKNRKKARQFCPVCCANHAKKGGRAG